MTIKERGPHYEVTISEDGLAVYWCHVLGNGVGSKLMLMREAKEVVPMMVRALEKWDEEELMARWEKERQDALRNP